LRKRVDLFNVNIKRQNISRSKTLFTPLPTSQNITATASNAVVNSYNTTSTVVPAIADTGSTHILVRESDSHILQDKEPFKTMHVTIPNGTKISSIAHGTLITPLTGTNIPAYVFPDSVLKQTLLSIAEFTNRGCKVELTNTDITIKQGDTVIFHGTKLPDALLWTVDICPPELTNMQTEDLPVNSQANLSIRMDTDAEFVDFMHATFGFPVTSSFLSAAKKGYLDEVPRLTPQLIAHNKPNKVQTAKGHLDQSRQGQNSTKVQQPTTKQPPTKPISPIDTDIFDDDSSEDDTHFVPDNIYSEVKDISDVNQSDLAGRMPYRSQKGNNYVLVSVYNGYIHYEPMANRSAEEYVKAYRKTVNFFRSKGNVINFQRLDNETSALLIDYLENEAKITVQLVPPGTHRTLKAERGIRDGKNHVISMLSGVPVGFPTSLWDESLPQAEITINHLRKYIPNPRISAYEGIHKKKYDFKAHPMAPFGMKILIHDKPSDRGSWAPHGQPGYYKGPALQHYRSWHTYCISTQASRVTDTIHWLPEPLHMPGSSPSEMITAAISDLTAAIRMLDPNIAPQARTLSDTATAALLELAQLYTPAQEQRVVAPVVQRVPQPVIAQHNYSLRSNTTAPQALFTEEEHGFTQDEYTEFLATQAPNLPSKEIVEAANQDSISAYAFAALNLTEDGQPLKLSTALKGPNAHQWNLSQEKEFDKLITETGAMHPIHYNKVPLDKVHEITYYNPQVKEKITSNGTIEYRVRGAVGGDRITPTGDVSSQTAELEAVKILLNSVISTPGARFITIDIKDFFLGTPMEKPEYVRIPLKLIPDATMIKYNLYEYVHKDYVMFEIVKGVYGLPQASKISQDRLIAHLATKDYTQDPLVPCILKHRTNGNEFSLVVDDFGVKILSDEGAHQLIDSLKELYEIKVDWTGSKYLGMHLKWEYKKEQVAVSVPGMMPKLVEHVEKTLTSIKQCASPSIYTPPKYGAGQQYTVKDNSGEISTAQAKVISTIVGVIGYYARIVDYTMVEEVNELASEQAHPTQLTFDKAMRLLGYAKAHPNNEIVFHRSDMILKNQSDASYLSRPESRSVAGGLAYLGNKNDDKINGFIWVVSKVIDVVVASAAEAEYGAVFINAQKLVWSRTICQALNHPQPATPILTDNECAKGIANNEVKLKRSKSMDMRFHWIRDRIKQGQFTVSWQKGADNLADFFTKALPVATHRRLMKQIVKTPIAAEAHFTCARARRLNKWRMIRWQISKQK
jgi:hypothetical protein